MARTDEEPAETERQGAVARLKARAEATLTAARNRSVLVDRLVRTARAYTSGGGDREAAALSYYAFLAVFPAILVAVAVLGLVMRDTAELRAAVLDGLSDALPGSSGFLATSLDAIVERAEVIGVVGLAGVAYSALGAVDVLRGALDGIFGVEKLGGLKGKLRNLRFVGITGALLALGIALGTGAGWGVDALLDRAGMAGAGARVAGTVVAIGLTFLTDVALFVVVFSLLPDHEHHPGEVLPGAVLAAGAWTLLKQVGGSLLAATASRSSAAYGVAAAVFGLLLAINLGARITLFSAQWAREAIARGREGSYPAP